TRAIDGRRGRGQLRATGAIARRGRQPTYLALRRDPRLATQRREMEARPLPPLTLRLVTLAVAKQLCLRAGRHGFPIWRRQAGQGLDLAFGHHPLDDLLAVNWHVARCANADLHATTIHACDSDHDVVIQDDRLADFAGENEHV